MQNQYFDQVQVPDTNKRFVDRSLQLGDTVDLLAMERQGISQDQLAVCLGLRANKIEEWFTGFHNFDLQTIADLEEVLQVDLLIPVTIGSSE